MIPGGDKKKPLQGVVVPVDNRSSVEHVQDACFENLLKVYTDRKDWEIVQLVNLLYGRVLADRMEDDVDRRS